MTDFPQTNPSVKSPLPKSSLISFLIGLQRFGGDLLGIFLISLGLLSLLGLFRLSGGSLISGWTSILEKGLGWGAYLFAAFLIYAGALILLRRIEKFPHINLERLIALEVFIFTFCAFLAILGGFSIERAEMGSDGGILGWGLARMIGKILPLPLCSIFLFLLGLIFLLSGFGIWRTALQRIRSRILSSEEVKAELTYINGEVTKQQGQDTQPGAGIDNSTSLTKNAKARGEKINGLTLPPLNFLIPGEDIQINKEFIHTQARQIEKTYAEFHLPVKVVGFRVGPTIVQYAMDLGITEKVNEAGVLERKKVQTSHIRSLQKDLTLALAVERLRFETPIPGHTSVGVEVPNKFGTRVRLREILEHTEFKKLKSPLSLAIGVDVANNPVVADLARMPHLLIGGATGSGKSICILGLILCLLMNNTPSELRLILLDPKKVELSQFEGIPHLMGPVEIQSKRMVAALQWAVAEMERRLIAMESFHARDLDSYNEKMRRRNEATLPRIVIFIDELSDLMNNEAEATEAVVMRLSQMARATGIHLVVSTQRPSVNVITGLIKSNFPARMAFMTASSTDSRVILDMPGAETLLGKGDLLFLNPEMSDLIRAQAPLIERQEIQKIVEFWQAQNSTEEGGAPWEVQISSEVHYEDELMNRAVKIIQNERRASASMLMLRMNIGFPRAARLMDELEEKGYIGPAESGGKERQVFPSSGQNDVEET